MLNFSGYLVSIPIYIPSVYGKLLILLTCSSGITWFPTICNVAVVLPLESYTEIDNTLSLSSLYSASVGFL